MMEEKSSMIADNDIQMIHNLELLNTCFKLYDSKSISYQLCDICFLPNDLVICNICKGFFHSYVI
jgi:hypothetical protein